MTVLCCVLLPYTCMICMPLAAGVLLGCTSNAVHVASRAHLLASSPAASSCPVSQVACLTGAISFCSWAMVYIWCVLDGIATGCCIAGGLCVCTTVCPNGTLPTASAGPPSLDQSHASLCIACTV